MFGRTLDRGAWRALIITAFLLSACAPAAPPSPTAAPAKPTEAPKPAAPAPAPAASPAAAAPAPAAPAASPVSAPAPAASPATAPAAAPAASPAAKPAAFDEKAVADFFAGKTIRVISGLAPGTGGDVYARIFARHMPRFIP